MPKIGDEPIIVDDILWFLRNRRDTVPKKDLVNILRSSVSIEEAKTAIQTYVSLRPSAPGEKARVRRSSQVKFDTIIASILDFMHEDAANLPTFAAVRIDRLPPTDLRNIDSAHLLHASNSVQGTVSEQSVALSEITDKVNLILAAVEEVLQLVKANESHPCILGVHKSINELITTTKESKTVPIKASPKPIAPSGVSSSTPTPSAPPPPSTPPLAPQTANTQLCTQENGSATPTHPSPPSSPLPHEPLAGTPHTMNCTDSIRATCLKTTREYADALKNERRMGARSPNAMEYSTKSDDEGFTNVSEIRKGKKKSSSLVKRGTGNLQAVSGISKLFVSLPVPGSRYSLTAMTCRIKQYIGDATFKCKKRFSTKGGSSPFEIYGKKEDLIKIFKAELWEQNSYLQFTESEHRLPLDINDDDQKSEEAVRRRIEELRSSKRLRRTATSVYASEQQQQRRSAVGETSGTD
jgi:hypothetical protein